MPAVAGRTSERRTVAGVNTTAASTAVTAPADSFNEEDAGRPISGTGIPADTTLASVTSPTAATLSAAATAIGTITATIGGTGPAAVIADAQRYGFLGWSPESDAESETYTIAGGASATSPGRITSPTQDQRATIIRSRA